MVVGCLIENASREEHWRLQLECISWYWKLMFWYVYELYGVCVGPQEGENQGMSPAGNGD